MNEVIVFDFDGVLCDSIKECMIVSYNAYWNNEVNVTDEISLESSNYFYRYRSLVRPAGEYFIIWESYYNNRDFKDASYDEMVMEYSSQISIFQKMFFVFRKILKKDLSYWLSLHTPYPNTLEYFNNHKSPVYILTNKDRDSVEIIATQHGYRQRIKGIYSSDISSDKNFLMNKLVAGHHDTLGKSHFYFIDDHIHNLRDVCTDENQNVTGILAKWGYSSNTPNQQFHEIANILELDDLIDSN